MRKKIELFIWGGLLPVIVFPLLSLWGVSVSAQQDELIFLPLLRNEVVLSPPTLDCLTVEIEPNGPVQAARNGLFCLNEMILGVMHNATPGEKDFYLIDLPEPDSLVITLSNIPANSNYVLTLWNVSLANPPIAHDGGTAKEKRLTTGRLEPDQYVLQVSYDSGPGSPEPYQLYIEAVNNILPTVTPTPSRTPTPTKPPCWERNCPPSPTPTVTAITPSRTPTPTKPPCWERNCPPSPTPTSTVVNISPTPTRTPAPTLPVATISPGFNLLQNGDFSDGFAHWYVDPEISYIRDGALCIDIADPGELPWSVGMGQNPLILSSGQIFTLSFDVWTETPRQIRAQISKTSPDSISYVYEKRLLISGWQRISTLPYIQNETITSGNVAFHIGAEETGTVCFDNVELVGE